MSALALSRAPGPRNSISPMCETSKRPTAVRTASCSAMSEEYCTGMSQPAKSTMRAPSLRWASLSGVRRVMGSLFSKGGGGAIKRADYNCGPPLIKDVGRARTGDPMKIRYRLNPSNPCFSFEFYPPKTDEGTRALLKTLEELAPLEPGFVSVTYGAGGSTRDRTVDLVTQIKRTTGITAMAHLTCVGHDREELRALLRRVAEAGVENVLVLRGDAPGGSAPFVPSAGGFQYASELVEFIRSEDLNFCLGGACYPEGHVETASREQDLANLKRKVDAGLDFVIT